MVELILLFSLHNNRIDTSGSVKLKKQIIIQFNIDFLL